MPIFNITTKVRRMTNGVMVEPGMSVQVVTQSFNNPLCTGQGQQQVADAFMRVYAVDVRRAGVLNMACMSCDRIG